MDGLGEAKDGWSEKMPIKINGVDMKDAVIKTEQFEMRILEFTPERFRVSVTNISADPFNFVQRFLQIVYPDRTVNVRANSGIVAVAPRRTVEQTIQMEGRITIQLFDLIQLRYAGKKLADISVE
jgi:hypothetical protein